MTAREHNRTVGILLLAYLGLQLVGIVIGVLFGMMFAGIAVVEATSHSNDAIPLLFVGAFVIVALLFSALLLVPIGVGGWKMFKEKPNAKNWGIAGSVIALLNFPLGMALGIYGLWFLLGDQGKQFYEGGSSMTSFNTPPPPNSWQ